MSENSDKFEQQIKRIHDLTEQPGSEITWNDRIADPDNPKQSRQIDISINRDGVLTHIECRLHKNRQDVKWIEELIGRRISLQADALIAVSASGFTKGAIKKAKTYGIILRDILSLTESEIRAWGKKTQVSVTFFKYEHVKIVFIFDESLKNKISLSHIEDSFTENAVDFLSLFDHIDSGVKKANPDLLPCYLDIGLSSKDLRINGQPIKQIKFSGNFQEIKQNFETPSVVAYDTPKNNALERNVYVEQVELGQFEIMQSADIVSMVIDLSLLKTPENCHFHSVNCLFTREVTMDSFYLIGLPKHAIALRDFDIALEFN